ncbi:MAG TPA: cysteine--tRNA ligase [Candidatus Fournierella excrementigallinarum]|uniref:cysteine--tRNA ligase n=1 Tax=Candidatus Allofournierella excrementigallinarum TaxID=2838592 RepID=UPI001F9B597B|nr:cysteine--tRNA ligase [Candidatus Fournierella excrementigallinarum]
MQIYNTLTRKKEEFIPQTPGEYRIYVCGPTVYNYIHIGNARPVVVFDTLRRYLEYRGNKVYFVSNITDIDDKLIKKAQEQGCSMKEVAEKFEAEFIKDSDGLNAKTPTVRPRATEHIEEILDIVKDILDKGYGYVAKNGDVYFRTRAFKEYGKLSHLNLEELESGNRELRSQMDDDLKEDPADFAVWKAAKPGEPAWPSPYGPGRPGWHIECSAMARKHLGKTIDLHCGGQDLIFPHHENEIAQSECANGCTFSRYWMHNGFLNIDNHKMSKSANNFFTVREIAEVFGYEPIRYFLLTAGYRMPLNYTVELLNSCKASLERLYTCRDNLDFLIKNAKGESNLLAEKAAAAKVKFNTAMDDDLNTPDALAAVFELVKDINTLGADASADALKAAAATFDELTGVLGLLYNRKTDEIPAEVMDLVNQRAEAKKAKDWPTADALRAKITEMGYVVEDTPQGPKVTRA